MEEHITSMAGAQGGTCMEVETLQEAIASLAFIGSAILCIGLLIANCMTGGKALVL
jgi:hypothetical protein